ncbi:hypothetical protein ROU88_08305 [Macrococcus capreoli]
MKNRKISVKEFQRIYAGSVINRVKITHEDIKQLNNMMLIESSAMIENVIKPINNGVQFKNYVGVIQISSGLEIEILPKIYGEKNGNHSKHLVLEMIQNTLNVKPKLFGNANLDQDNQSLLEIFIGMFVDEVKMICQKGLVSEYETMVENHRFLKGKLLFHQQLKYNNVNQSKFYSEYDAFSNDHKINRLIKAALIFLSRQFISSRLLREIHNVLPYFEGVNHMNISKIEKEITLNRRFHYYDKAIRWAMLIIQNQSLNNYSGNHAAISILFPMEKLYEEYIANKLKQTKSLFTLIDTQHSQYSLFNIKNNRKVNVYRIKPDIVNTYTNSDEVIIIDTKWKILDRIGPSQSDLYQMFAYYTRYRHFGMNVKKVVLLYPYSEQYSPSTFKSLNTNMGLESVIEVMYVDFTDKDWVNKLWEKINKY